MILVLSVATVLWLIGWLMKAPRRARWTMIGLWMAAILLGHVLLPDGHPIRAATGHDVRLWALIIGFGGAIALYRVGLGRLRAQAQQQPSAPVTAKPTFSDTELDRYARHMMLREIGGLGQKKIKNAKVLVIGAGGLGSASLLYLAAAGVGTVGIVDDDVVDNSNLQRQIIHADARIGQPKVQSAAAAMVAINPWVTTRLYNRRLTETEAEDLFAQYDLILDGTDNFATRYMVNQAAVRVRKPLIAAAMTQWEGQISLYDPAHGGPCYQCVFPEAPAPGLVPSCAEAGVLGPLPGVIGSMMAAEAIKQITGAGQGLRGRLMIYDALYADSRILRTKLRDDCPCCSGGRLPS